MADSRQRGTGDGMTEPERRRRRPAISCSLCRRRKIRCNRETPCSNCLRSKNVACIYEVHPQNPNIVDRASSTSTSSVVSNQPIRTITTDLTSPSTSEPSAWNVEPTKCKIRQLDEQLLRTTQTITPPPAPVSGVNIETTTSRLAGVFNTHHELRSLEQAQDITRSVMHKTRIFGQSHFINGVPLFRDLLEIIEPRIQEETSKAFSGIQRCKILARTIKQHRAPIWPSLPKTDLPSKDVADELVEGYFRTIETIYRILHIPSFKKEYEALWVSNTEPDMAFLMQLKLVLAIGATVYDEHFSLRTSAVQWVYEAQTWLSAPEFKSRLSIQSLQISLLLLLARETADLGGDLIWISAGALLRTAIYMGLHRDPERLPRMTMFTAELRRRLWNTILELTLQSSITSGGPPLLSHDDFDTRPPANLDDGQLMTEDPVPKSEDKFTSVCIPIALRKMFFIRLAITKFLNGLGSSGTYEETLRLDAELKSSYKTVRGVIQGYNSSDAPSPPQFALRVVDFIFHRYLSALHIPFFGPSMHQTAYTFSRKVVTDTSLKIWRAAYPSSPTTTPNPRGGDASSTNRDDFAHLTICGHGFFRTVAFQASFLIAVELRSQIQEEQSLGPISLRPDLVAGLDDAKTWSLKCIEAGETNIKGYLLLCMLGAQIDGLTRELCPDKLADLLIQTIEDAEEKCLLILEKMARQGGCPVETATGFEDMAMDVPSEAMENWDFLMSDALFDFGDMETGRWGVT